MVVGGKNNTHGNPILISVVIKTSSTAIVCVFVCV